VNRLAGELDGRLCPFVANARHAGIGQLGAGFAQQHVVEVCAVCAADQVHGRHTPANIELVADAGVDEEQIVIEVGNDRD
jgi:hypothetical protein